MAITQESSLIKVSFVLSTATTILYIIAFACPYWIQKDFSLQVPGKYLDPNFPPHLADIPFLVEASSYMGLLGSCNDVTVKIPGQPDKKSHDCGSDGAEDWQYAAAGFGIAALCLGVGALALSTGFLFLYKKTYFLKLKYTAVIVYFLTTASIMIPTVLYATKKEFQVKPPLPDRFEYDLHWAFYLAITSIVLYGILVLLNMGLICNPCSDKGANDPSVRYKADDKSTP